MEGRSPKHKRNQQVSLRQRYGLDMRSSPFSRLKGDTRSHEIPCTGSAHIVHSYLGVAFSATHSIANQSLTKNFHRYSEKLDSLTQDLSRVGSPQDTTLPERISSELKRLSEVVQGYLSNPRELKDIIPKNQYGTREVVGYVVTPVGLVLYTPPDYRSSERSRFKKMGDGVYAVSSHLSYETETNIMMSVAQILSEITQRILPQNSRTKGLAQRVAEAVISSERTSFLQEVSPSVLVDSLSSAFASVLPKMARSLFIDRDEVSCYWSQIVLDDRETDKPLTSSVYPSRHDQVRELDMAFHEATKVLSDEAKKGSKDAQESCEALCNYTREYKRLFHEKANQLHRMIFIASILGPLAIDSLQAHVITTPPSRFAEIEQKLKNLCGEPSYQALKSVYEILEGKPFNVESMDQIMTHMKGVDPEFYDGFSPVLRDAVGHQDSSTTLAPKDLAELNKFLKQVSQFHSNTEFELARKGLLEILECDTSYGFINTANALMELWRSDPDVAGEISQSVVPDLFDAPVYIRQLKNMWKRRNEGRLPSRSEVVNSPLVVLLGNDARSKNRLLRIASKGKETGAIF